jgi:hypothetical protein
MIRKILFALLFCLPVIVLLPHLDQFVFQPGSQYSDMAVSHYPNGIFLQQTIRKYAAIPTWSDSILSGSPFSADPLSGLHYPPGWLALLFPLPLGFHLVLIIHLVAGGWGTYLLLRSEGIHQPAAVLGGLVFAAMPKLYAHLGAGHLTILYAVCLTPWLLYLEKRSWKNKLLRFLLPGFLLGCIALADVRWSAYAGIIWGAYLLRDLIGQIRILRAEKQPCMRMVFSWVFVRLSNIVLAGLTSAPLLLPLSQFIRLSTREHLTAAENTILSLPPAQLIGLVYPNIGGPAEWILYPGAAVLILVIYALLLPAARRRSGFWLGTVLITLLFALGANIPLVDKILGLPGLNLLRVPPRALFLTGFAFSMAAGYALHSLLLQEQPAKPQKNLTNLVIFSLTAFFTLLAAAVWMVVPQSLARIQFTWGAVFLLAGAAAIFLARMRKISPSGLIVLVTSICLIDLLGVNGLSLVFTPVSEVLSVGKPAADLLSGQKDIHAYRIYSPSYSLPQQTAAVHQFELADGIDPMQLAAYSDFMQHATGVDFGGYSVTLPAFASGSPEIDNHDAIVDARQLGLLSVGYIVSAFPLDTSQLDLLERVGNTWVYSNPFALPRAWIQPPETELGDNILAVESWLYSPNQIRVAAAGPGMLVLSELDYPGWQVTLDGKPAKVVKIGGLLRGVSVPAGRHQVTFTFIPVLYFLGMGLFVAACILLIGASIWGRKANG